MLSFKHAIPHILVHTLTTRLSQYIYIWISIFPILGIRRGSGSRYDCGDRVGPRGRRQTTWGGRGRAGDGLRVLLAAAVRVPRQDSGLPIQVTIYLTTSVPVNNRLNNLKRQERLRPVRKMYLNIC